MIAWLIIPFIAFWLGVHQFQSAWASLIFYHLFLLFPLLIHRKQWRLQTLFQGFSFTWLLIHIAGCTGLFFWLTFLAKSLGFELAQSAALKSAGIGFVIYFILINPIFEEIFWRDLMAKKSRKLTLEDITFGAFHSVILQPFLPWLYILGFVAMLTTIAWLWRQIRFKQQGLAIPWLGHTLGDAMFTVIVWYLISR